MQKIKWKMGGYCRISKEDGEDKNSESILNQRRIIQEYISKKEEMELIDFYIDDGYSGLFFSNRPAFQCMMKDLYSGKIQGVITKDLSRLGREYIETSNYVERIFPTLGIRYISILDGIDSLNHRNEELAPIKSLLNDMYSRDISKKIKGSLLVQKQKGKFMSGFPPYGYRKNPQDKHHFLIDQEAAGVVKKIYKLYLDGYSKNEIARILNREGILTPSQYKSTVQKSRYVNAKGCGKNGWTYSTIHMILKNPVYTGAMVQHKSEKISYKLKKCRYIPKNEQYVVEGMHEPIVDKELFEKVQRRNVRNT